MPGRPAAVGSRVSGAVFAACLAAAGAPGGSLTLFVGVAIAMGWVTLTSARLIAEQRKAGNVALAHCSMVVCRGESTDRRARKWPLPGRPSSRPRSTMISPREIVVTGQPTAR